jgi:hypothetical protein
MSVEFRINEKNTNFSILDGGTSCCKNCDESDNVDYYASCGIANFILQTNKKVKISKELCRRYDNEKKYDCGNTHYDIAVKILNLIDLTN